MMLPWQKRPLALNSPRDLPGLALWLDSKDVSSLRNDAGAQPVTTDGIKLASDKSGNSSTNVLCLGGAASNYASAPNAAPLQITGDLDIRWYGSLQDWTPAARAVLVSKYNSTGNQRGYWLAVTTGGNLELAQSTDGTAVSTFTSSVATGTTDFAAKWVRATLDVDNGAAGRTVTFYTSDDGSTWTPLGTAVTIATATNTFNCSATLNIGGNDAGALNVPFGNVSRVQIYSGIAGTLAFDANFATAAKLAPSFTESSSNAATVTINTSGATGARISGARDLYQGTAANQPILTIAAAGNYLTFDGSNDYLKAAAFALAQPTSVYFVGSAVSWTSTDIVLDGGQVSTYWEQRNSSPNVRLRGNVSALADITTWALGTNAVLTVVANGASSSERINRSAANTGTVDSTAMNGLTLGANAGGTSGANITAQEVVVYSGAHDKATQDRVIAYLANRNRIALT